MKLRNKKTGEIKDVQLGNHNDPSDGIIVVYGENGQPREPQAQYSSLAELNAEWEDAPEEPKEYWYIGADGEILYEPTDGYKFDMDCKRQIQETDKGKSKLDTKETAEFIVKHYGDVLRKLAKS